MGNHLESLEQALEEHPIILPKSTFWDVFKRFGRDELIALIINSGATAGIEYAFDSNVLNSLAGPLSRRSKDGILALSGPITEKAGFFPAHFREAWKEYRDTPVDQRDPLSSYFKSAVKSGSKSLAEDILVHDPLYVGLMYLGLNTLPQVPAWGLSIASFVAAVFAVAGAEVAVHELAYNKYLRDLKKAGFGSEQYIEARFHYPSELMAEEVFEMLVKRYELSEPASAQYKDRYFENELPVYGGRKPRIRLRERDEGNGGGMMRSAQIIYTKASEMHKKSVQQERFFPIKKNKLYFLFEDDMAWHFDDIRDDRARRIMKRAQTGTDYQDVAFYRRAANDPSSIMVTLDYVQDATTVVELKVFHDKDLLKDAMRFTMRRGGLETTYSKKEIADFVNPRYGAKNSET